MLNQYPVVVGKSLLQMDIYKPYIPILRKRNNVSQMKFKLALVMGDVFWGFQLYDIIPDLVVLGKPMKRHPIGGVIST